MKSNNSIYGNLDDFFLFCSVVEAGSLSKAAAALNMPASTLSRRLDALQKRLGVSLLTSYKRELTPTDFGRRIFEALYPSMWQIDSAIGAVQAEQQTLKGTVRVTVPRAFYYDVVRHSVRTLRRQYPGVHFVSIPNQFPLVASLDVDCDILMTFDDLSELGDFVAVPLYRTKLGIFAHRDFFKDREPPATLKDLAKCPWIGNYAIKERPLFHEERLVEVLDVEPVVVVNDIHAVADEIRAGVGIGMIPIAKARKHPELVRLFDDINGKIRQSYLIYRKHRYKPRVIEVTVEQIRRDAIRWFSRNDDWAVEREMKKAKESAAASKED